MDQTVLSGVGNVYRAEVLFRNRINPHRPGQQAEPEELARHLVRPGRADAAASATTGSTPSGPSTPPRRWVARRGVDDHGGEVYVYRRAGMACLVCGSKVRTEVLAGRNLFWCGRCQRRG